MSTKASTTETPAEDGLAPAPQNRVVYYDGKQFVAPASNRFFRGYAPAIVPGLTIVPNLPDVGLADLNPLSFDEWKQIVAFHRWSVAEFNAETLISHLVKNDGTYLHCPFHQDIRRGSMTIAVDYTKPENAELLRQFQEEYGITTGDFHSTTHNHVKMGAFASGVDSDDETSKQGFHFTVGNMDLPTISIHGRIRINFSPLFDEEGERIRAGRSYLCDVVGRNWSKLIDIPGYDPQMPKELADTFVEFTLKNCKDEGFPEEWKSYCHEIKHTYSGGGSHGSRPGGTNFMGGNVNGASQSQGGFKATWPWNHNKTSGPSGGKGTPVNTPAGAKLITTTSNIQTPGVAVANNTTESGKTNLEADPVVVSADSISREHYGKYSHFLHLLLALAEARVDTTTAKEWAAREPGEIQMTGPLARVMDDYSQRYDAPAARAAWMYVADFLDSHPQFNTEIGYTSDRRSRAIINQYLTKIDKNIPTSATA